MIGPLGLDRTLTSREEINRCLWDTLDETTGRWGIKVARAEVTAIEPPPCVHDSDGEADARRT
ncbi:hypothetical protein GCM10025331_51520 [Actinoplanes utahensis]|uniref:Uncharacterized protein n=1 Tax=Actinoplanes utahensis TaxID=1869 RepID=A0A0A6URW2_ACTUT|nr:hypothetical protein MB27_12170 [Actinoplanes utahensis]GIF33594.1 hypothetical protein Aut01nite_65800 [Actinoplanes utahensis]